MPAARAIATRWSVWLVEPPVAMQADDAVDDRALVDDLADRRVVVAQRGDLASRAAAAAAVSASRSGVFGLTKAAPGRCRPMISISIWLELAVP